MYLAGDDGGDDDESATVGASCRAQAVSASLLCTPPLAKAVLVCVAPPWICY